MASVASEAAIASLRGNASAHERAPQDAATTAWVWALPCAALAVLAIVVLGPLLGGLLLPSDSPYTFVGPVLTGLHPEPTEQGRYLIAICAPLLVALALATVPARRTRLPDSAIGPLVVGA